MVVGTSAIAFGQTSGVSPLTPPTNGPRRVDPTWLALVDATVHVSPTQTLGRATVVMRGGRIISVTEADPGPDGKHGTGDDVATRLPIGPRVLDGKGLHAYAGFVDPYVEVDAPKPDAKRAGVHWNDGVTPQRSALDGGGLSDGAAKELRDLGFTAACITPRGGVFRGQSALVSTAAADSDPSMSRPPVYVSSVYQSVAMELGGRAYPDSQMGAIALIRQTLSDADWAAANGDAAESVIGAGEFNALRHLIPLTVPSTEGTPTPLSLVFDTADELEALRVAKIAREFKRSYMILGCGTEFARLDAIATDLKADKAALLLPVSFPKAPDVASMEKAESVELRDMMTWEQAPTNARRLHGAGVTFAFTTAKLRDKGNFLPNIRKFVRYGLPKEVALASLTTTPAALLAATDQVGTIEAGKRANIVVMNEELFDKQSKMRMLLVDGQLHQMNKPDADVSGTWTVLASFPDDAVRTIVISKGKPGDGDVVITKTTPGKPAEGDKPEVKESKVEAKARKVSIEGNQLTYVFEHDEFGADGLVSSFIVFDLDATPPTYIGRGMLPDGREFSFSGERQPDKLTGVWPTWFPAQAGQAAFQGAALVFDEKNTLTGREPFEKVSPVAVKNFAWDGKTVSYALDLPEQAGGEVTITMTPDLSADPDVARGVVKSKNGEFHFTSVRRDANPFRGTWRVSKADGKDVPADRKEQIRVSIGEKDMRVTRTLDDGTTKEAKGKDEKFEDGTYAFTHSLNELGFDFLGKEGSSSDKLVIRFGETLKDDTIEGTSTFSDGSTHTYVAQREVKDDKKDEDDAPTDIPEKLGLPFGPYAMEAMPAQDRVYLTNATVWTNTDQGVLEGATVLLSGGKIEGIYRERPAVLDLGDLPEGTRVIDCGGKHITAGIIDAHSHTGISKGVNEGGQAVTAEVRIADVTNPDDVNWYRQLAGGVTSVLSLHGSANAIGGQSQTNKLRWGCARPDDMHFEGAIAGIKFALGENPRSVNWDAGTGQYPRSRMGVEKLIRDRFTAAKDYEKAVQDGKSAAFRKDADETSKGGGGIPIPRALFTHPREIRRDLELEALVEILAGERLIHCHSYRQDEIVMLTQVARDFDFKIGTFQHVLEGYKVADYVRDYSGGGSGFSDWWAFKVEVQDAIPAGFPLMHKVGAVASFNSDSNSLARHLNVEAGKAVKYGREVGGVSAEDAWKFVTLNPAKQLRVDDRVGAIKEGLDADIVVWTGDPMSTFSKAERTFVDGRELFSLEQDAKHRATITAERQRLIAKLLDYKKKNPEKADDKKDEPAKPGEFSDQQLAAIRARQLEIMRSGRDPFYAPGVCGCGVMH